MSYINDLSTIKNHIVVDDDQRKHVRAFVTAFNFPSSLEELYSDYLLEGGQLDIEYLLHHKDYQTIEWTVPKWAKPGDICMFYFAKTADVKLRRVQKEFDLRSSYLNQPVKQGLDALLKHGWHYFNNYAGYIFAIGQVVGIPYYRKEPKELSHYKNTIYAEITGITILKNPLHISEFRDVVFITRGATITPVFGREFDVVRERIMDNNKVPDYFANCSTKPIPLRSINSKNWMTITHEYRNSFILEGEFRACYVDYLLQGISDDGIVYRECRTKKRMRHKSKKGFVDNVILFNGKYLPVEVKLNIEAEPLLQKQCERYCHLGSLFLTENLAVSRKRVYGSNVLVVDTVGLYMYSSANRKINEIVNLDDIAQNSLDEIKEKIAEVLTPIIK